MIYTVYKKVQKKTSIVILTNRRIFFFLLLSFSLYKNKQNLVFITFFTSTNLVCLKPLSLMDYWQGFRSTTEAAISEYVLIDF